MQKYVFLVFILIISKTSCTSEYVYKQTGQSWKNKMFKNEFRNHTTTCEMEN